jgi:thioredoxin reductase
MNQQFDIIIIGDSKAGKEVLKRIASKKPSIKIAFISREFKTSTTHDYLNVEYIKDEVTFTDYKNRLFGCYLKSGIIHYCTHLIIASGLGYRPFMVGNKAVPGVFNTATEIPKSAKQQVAVVVGNSDVDAKLALAVAKKYKYAYLCTKDMTLEITEATKAKLNKAENILVIPNVSITKATFEDGVLSSVSLDNYSKITCNAIFAKTEAIPETAFVSEKLISKENGYLKTTNISQSILVPKCYAIGNCAAKSTKKMQTAMIESVLNDFNGG